MSSLRLSEDAMTVLGLAGTALAFAENIDDEVERWLRPLALFGRSGESLQALGVGDATSAADRHDPETLPRVTPQETLHLITTAASTHAAARGAETVGTLDILHAVIAHYGAAFERALDRRGDGPTLVSQLAAQAA
jgi:hypothetical protein